MRGCCNKVSFLYHHVRAWHALQMSCFRNRLKPQGNQGFSVLSLLLHPKVIEKQRAVVEIEVNEDDVDAHWYKDGIEINFEVQERHQYVVERRIHRMFISETRHSDAGEYTFVAGRNRSSVTLYVNGR